MRTPLRRPRYASQAVDQKFGPLGDAARAVEPGADLHPAPRDWFTAEGPNPVRPPRVGSSSELAGYLEGQTSPTSQLVEIRKNGGGVIGSGAFIVRSDSGYSNQMHNIASAVLPLRGQRWRACPRRISTCAPSPARQYWSHKLLWASPRRGARP